MLRSKLRQLLSRAHRYIDYERGLEQLIQQAQGTIWYNEIFLYGARLREILNDERLYGLTEITRSELAQTIDWLNDLAYEHLKVSFVDLCMSKNSDQSNEEVLLKARTEIEKSLAANHPHVLVRIPNGRGKTHTLVNVAYRLLAFANAQRILYLVRNGVERATYRRFEQFNIPDSEERFTKRFNVQILQNRVIDTVSNVCISTVEQFYSAFSGVQIVYNEYNTLQESRSDQEHTGQRKSNDEEIHIQYNPFIPIEFFDVILIDNCVPDTYQRWRPMLEYFDAFIIGATSNIDEPELSFFHKM